MASELNKPLLVICGPTASGKSGLAMEVAQKHSGEIICADSRTIYRNMDIGTAKPSQEDQQLIRHHLLDVVEPGESFSAFDFKQKAEAAIGQIRARGNLPIVVGGTGLYIDGLVFDYSFAPSSDPELRKSLEEKPLLELHEYCKKNNIKLPENEKNKRYVVRNIEKLNSVTTGKIAPDDTTIIVGITTDKSILRTRIVNRAEHIFENGIVEEAKILGKKYGWNNSAMTGNIYSLIRQYIEGGLTLGETQEKFVTFDWRLAKRQMTWLRRNPFISWHELDSAIDFIDVQLAKIEQK